MPPERLISMLLVLALAATMWADQTSPPPQPEEGALPVSIDRVHERLQRPALTIPPPDPRANFRIKIEEPGFPVETVLEGVRRDLAGQPRFSNYSGGGGPFTTPPLITSPNMIDVAASMVKGIRDARRARAERTARRTVAEELAAFCAEHDCSKVEPGTNPREGVIVETDANPAQ